MIILTPYCDVQVPMVHSFMFYDYHTTLEGCWIDTVRSLFSAFNESPSKTHAIFGDKIVNGGYSRTLKRLRTLISENTSNSYEVCINSPEVFRDCVLFSCNVQVNWFTDRRGFKYGLVAVRENEAWDLTQVVDRISPILFESTGACYAHAFNFPAAFGPGMYLSTVKSNLPNRSPRDNDIYGRRLVRWRIETMEKNKRPNHGYLRELYPVNILTSEQLENIQIKFGLREYIQSVGRFRKTDYAEDLYRWDIPDRMLLGAQLELEGKGIILSSLQGLKRTEE